MNVVVDPCDVTNPEPDFSMLSTLQKYNVIFELESYEQKHGSPLFKIHVEMISVLPLE